MNVARHRPIAVTALTVALLAAGCSGDSVRFLGEQVKDPGQFLSSIEQSWRADLTKARVSVHKEARCYFSKGEESKDIDALAFCGPVRHYTEAPESGESQELTGTDAPGAIGGGVWDTYTFEGQAIEGGYQLATPSAETRGAVLPTGIVLFRLDDKKPPTDGDKLAAPPPPAAKPGFIGLTDISASEEGGNGYASAIETVKIDKPFKISSSQIETPALEFELDAAGTTERIKTADGTRTAAPNEVFLVGEFSATEGMWSDVYSGGEDAYTRWDDPFPMEKIVKVTPAFTLITSTGRVDLPFDGQGTVVVSVPKGQLSASLEVATAGRAQSIAFETGKVTGGAPAQRSVGLNYQYAPQKNNVNQPTFKVTSDAFEGTHSLRFVNATLIPFHPLKGWAKQGKTWLVLETADATYDYDLFFYDITRDVSNSTIVKAKGVTSRNVGEPTGDWDDNENQTEWPIFEVDQTVSSFQVTYQPIWHYKGKPAGYHPDGMAKFKPMTFTVTFA